jgi:hypothetical protein
MRAREFLIEKARGLLYRSPGDPFKDPQGQEIRFVNVSYYPGIPGAYSNPEQVEAAKKKVENTKKGIQWSNNPSSSLLAFAVLEFDIVRNGQLNGKKYFGRFFKQITNNMEGAWKNNDLPGSWQLQKASSLKSSFKLKPADIFVPNAEFKTPQELINAMTNSQNGAQWAQETAAILGGQLPIYRDAKDKETAIRDDLGEVLAPLALVQNLISSPGLTQAQNDLNEGNDWSGTIRFPQAKNAGLVDSEVILPTGVVLGISSKGKAGATASIKNAFDGYQIIEQQSKSGTGEKAEAAERLIAKYAAAANILKKISTNSAIDGPLVLAEEFGILTQADSALIKTLIKENHKDLTQVQGTPEQLEMLSQFAISNANKAHPSYNIGYHILAGVAVDIASMVNSDKTINFSEACLKFVNASPIVQIYTSTQVAGNDVKVSKFDALYPPNFKGSLLLDASKVYYATGNNGRYTFAYSPTATQPPAAPKQVQAPSEKSKKLIKKPAVKSKTRTKR